MPPETPSMRALALLLLWALTAPASAQPLRDLVLVLDPGHGDRGTQSVPADPGTGAPSLHGQAWECVFTWDTAMRVKRLAEQQGARVFLTLQDPDANYAPQDWSPDDFPIPGAGFAYKTLVDAPDPESVEDALLARVATANQVYRSHSAPVYFLSLHFDSTSPRLAGVSFYYPAWRGGGGSFVAILEDELRRAGRARIDLPTGAENQLSQPHRYAILSQSLNPDSYLIELGNIRSDPDLWRMRDPQVRQEYAEIITTALARDLQRPAQDLRSPRLPHVRIRKAAELLSLLTLLTLVAWRLRALKKSAIISADS